ncbi:H-type lectin domain-containing protein [Nocardia abscessus]|uniref:H-type lectin domain-containing protein n=1 Tax=Nocardia abscessus TaxID=120957 RepID=UPI0024571D72|nr:H-type lectin domain-containing protein [Nocardia abscessus]
MQITPVVNNAQSSFSQTMTSNGGTLYIQFSGSGWRGSAGKISVDLLMDGTVIATASVYTNEATSHKALVPVAIVIPAAAGQHTFTVAPTPGSGTNIDQNDYFTVTVNETTPNHFEKGKASVGYLVSPGWALTSGTGWREWREPIAFAKSFNSPPEVTVGLSMVDIGNGANSRVMVDAENVTGQGFDLVVKAWSNTVLYSVNVDWLAFGDAQ